ncbi:hypothetical protein KUTeg_016280 [Tegillarca granosa]|uniref:Uncharacterized protein n=1 Tax=Tegillarca granosa TaxID=220873 RepID=A0ABQ9EKL7_TEGGR|nr:hypothetical protein KUTeg_016280 [Tegillarca granosa]
MFYFYVLSNLDLFYGIAKGRVIVLGMKEECIFSYCAQQDSPKCLVIEVKNILTAAISIFPHI